MKLTDAIIDVFSIDGDLSRHIKGFRPRDEQLEMAQVVAEAIESKSTVIVEAGTGTGKTFAYLAPVLLAGKKQLSPPVLKIYKINYLTVIYRLLRKH
ncbi:DEAD/DEAH box helicase domain protein [Haemophilus pittmaniae HK 85]|uniref:DEAD/DEAH box helicase domain protein n=1 Tax=Haemophilus pittmaniae HK 85 TaxID=1035188 RepID=F9Q5U7_9PAST|nr:DEAD/DEAH box helicase domain protein [Haemophilus pittmaniae HK 85]